jgi:3-oxoadipate enol-lactonase
MPYLEVNNAKLFYLELGSGDIAVIFGHGTFISSNIWRDFFFPHIPENWRVLAPDFRGHGASSSVQNGCNFVQMAEDVAEFIRLKKMGKVVYVGLSMGGGVGLQMALNNPELLRGMVLISSVTGLGPLGNSIFTKLGPYMAGKRWLLRLGMLTAASRKPTRKALNLVVDEAMQVSSQTLKEYLSSANKIVGVEHINEIELPILQLVGLKDKVIPVKQQLQLGKALSNCRIVSDPEAGHALCAEKPEWVLKHINEFVSKLQDV